MTKIQFILNIDHNGAVAPVPDSFDFAFGDWKAKAEVSLRVMKISSKSWVPQADLYFYFG